MRLVQSYIYMLMIASCGLIGFTESSKKTDSPSPMCPTDCRCLTTTEGLHKAVCSSLQSLYKYTHVNKHHNVNIIDLSYSNLTKINDELDSFTEIVALDISNNSIKILNKFLPHSKKLVHLNLNNNELKHLSASAIPSSVSSLDVQFNLLKDVPTELNLLHDLEHLQLEGNPLHCSCANIKILNSLNHNGVVIDNVRCKTPQKWKNVVWSELKLNHLCSYHSNKEIKSNDEVMFADDPATDADSFGDLLTEKKIETSESDLSAGEVFEDKSHSIVDEDENEFLHLSTEKPKYSGDDLIEGSGEFDRAISPVGVNDQLLDVNEGSGDDGSGDIPKLRLNLEMPSSTPDPDEEYDEGSGTDPTIEDTTTTEKVFITGLFHPHFGDFGESDDDRNTSTVSKIDGVFGEKIDWNAEDDPIEEVVNVGRKIAPVENTPQVIEPEKTEPEDVTTAKEVTEGEVLTSGEADGALNGEIRESKNEVSTPTGTYVCIGLIIAILVGLIILSIVKGQMRKSKNQRLSRQQPADIEKAGKEMVDMNKSLLGKPALATNDIEKKVNGKYESVPTHETFKKKQNGTTETSPNTLEIPKTMETQNGAPVSNGNSSTDHAAPAAPATPAAPEESLERPIPLTPLRLSPIQNQNGYSDHDSMPYQDDHSPTSGIVKIKLSETQKPKTPVLVTRSRSNAGDIIITPVENQSLSFKPKT